VLLKYQKTISSGNQNSYKFALGFAILDRYDGTSRLAFSRLSEIVAKLYYRNHVVFRLRETNNASQEPNAIKIIAKYLEQCGMAGQPPKQLSGYHLRELAKLLVEPPSGWGRSLFAYVLPCWQGASRDIRGYYVHPKQGANEFFSYDVVKKEIALSDSFMTCINQHKMTLLSLSILEWAQFLEKFNISPNLITKLRLKKPRRRLDKFRRIFCNLPELNLQNCFLCGRALGSDFTLDHVVPFDFVYSDDLWNLVPAHKECNSTKGSRVGSASLLERLSVRNRSLYEAATNNQPFLKPWISDQFQSPAAMEERIQQLVRNGIAAGYPVDLVYR